MPDTKTSSTSSSRPHEHNQGNQNRSYTAEQKAAVDRVRKCKATDFYAILDVEKSVTADGVKKAYRKLALVMHPDKNGAPGADEAFKLISKAFQVLSDPQQREHFDQFGGDPTSRSGGGGGRGGGGGGGGGGGDPFAGFRGGPGFANGPEISPEELFNMFFGGGFGGGGFGGATAFGGGPFGEFVSFGGPGIRVQHFGGPGLRRRRPPTAGTGGGAADAQEQQQEASLRSTFIQLLPLIILFIFPIISSLFGELGSGNSGSKPQFPDVRFEEVHPFTQHRVTEKNHIHHWVIPKQMQEYGLQGTGDGVRSKLKEMDRRVESRYRDILRVGCSRELSEQQREIEAAMGWFWADTEKTNKAKQKKLPTCDALERMKR